MSVDRDVRDVMDTLEGRKRYHAPNIKYPYQVNAGKTNFSVVGCDDGTCDHLHFMLKDDEVDVDSWYTWCSGSTLVRTRCD